MIVGRRATAAEAAASAAPTSRRAWTLAVTCLGVALVMASMIALNIALEDIALATNATQTQLTWVVDGYTLVLACLLLPAGALGDRYGRREAMLIGLAIFAVGSIGPVFFDSPIQMIAARAVAGLGAALIMPATLSLLTVVYPPEDRTKAVGIWAGVAGSGAIIGMLGSVVLLHVWSWQSIFWALGGSAAALFALTLTVTSSRDPDAPPVDWPGAVLIGAAVGVFVYGIIEAPARGWTNPVVYCSVTAGIALAVAFGFVEFRRRQPLLEVRLFADPAFATGAATIVVFFGANFGLFYLEMQFLQLVKDYSPMSTALAFSPLIAGVASLSALSFWYLPKLGLRLVVFIGLMLMAVAFFWLYGIDVDSTYPSLLWRLLLLSVGLGLLTAPTTWAIMNAVPDQKQGVASAVNDLARELGAAIGIAIAGSVLAAHYTHSLASQLSAFPEPVRGPASDSLAQAQKVSDTLGPQGPQLSHVAETAFMDGMHSSLLVVGIIVAVSAVLIGLWAPGRDGQQLRLLRRPSTRRRATDGEARSAQAPA
jgi:EmrB/QacA subfamily drug resistance transporter